MKRVEDRRKLDEDRRRREAEAARRAAERQHPSSVGADRPLAPVIPLHREEDHRGEAS